MIRRRQPSRLWRALAEAPYLPIAAYLGIVGAVGLASGEGIAPDSLNYRLPLWLVIAWTVAITAGGILAAVGGLARRTRVESAGLGFLAVGGGLYGAIIAVAGSPFALATSAAIVSMCLIRMRVLSLARRAREVAQDISDNGEH